MVITSDYDSGWLANILLWNSIC